jgi:hypothetical protein
MGEGQHEEQPEVRQVYVSDTIGVTVKEGLVIDISGPDTSGIRVSDSRGWTAAGDMSANLVERASATGIPSSGEDLTLETAEMLVRRLNREGGTWAAPHLLPDRVGRGVDCIVRDAADATCPPLLIQVTRPPMIAGFWASIRRDAKVELAPDTVEAAVKMLWVAIEDKRLTSHNGILLALNVIRAPWLALPPIVESFRRLYGEAASHQGWVAIWVVGANDTYAERLDLPAAK